MKRKVILNNIKSDIKMYTFFYKKKDVYFSILKYIFLLECYFEITKILFQIFNATYTNFKFSINYKMHKFYK